MAAPVLQFKRGLFSNLPALRAGEPGFTTDKYDLYVGIDSTTSNNQFVGSGRFWTIEGATSGSGVNLVEGTNNGTSYITLASPASLAGIVTYYFPGTQGGASSVLTNDGNGNLSWGVNWIKFLAAVAPLLGLLGTVIGMIETCQAITVFGTGDPKQMAGGISEALVTTMLGLIFAAPLLAMSTLLSEQVSEILQEIEEFVAVTIVKKVK